MNKEARRVAHYEALRFSSLGVRAAFQLTLGLRSFIFMLNTIDGEREWRKL
jgi:hypothetical protein